MKAGEVVSVAAKWTMAGAILVLAAACESNGGGSTCFPADHGPSEPSCAGFQVGLSCPVGVSPWYTCTCTQSGATPTWVCAPAGSTGGAGGAGGSGTGGSGGTGGADGGE